MTKTQKSALLIAVASALAFGAVATSFAQEAPRYGYSQSYVPNGGYYTQSAPSSGNGDSASGGSDY